MKQDIDELREILEGLNEPLRGSVVKTASRLIYKLRGENTTLKEALDAEQGVEGMDPIVRMNIQEGAHFIVHTMGRVLNAECMTIEALEVQARSMKRLAEALSILARGHVEQPEDEGEGQ